MTDSQQELLRTLMIEVRELRDAVRALSGPSRLVDVREAAAGGSGGDGAAVEPVREVTQ